MTVYDPGTDVVYKKDDPVTHGQLESRLDYEIKRRNEKTRKYNLSQHNNSILIGVVFILLAFCGTYFGNRLEREGAEYTKCVETREARKQGNVRAKRQILLEKAVVHSNVKAQKEIHSYHFPSEITKLKHEPPVKVLPPIKC